MTTITVAHTCEGVDHLEAVSIHRVVKLNCGCRRHEGTRCDGTGLHHIVGAHCEARES